MSWEPEEFWERCWSREETGPLYRALDRYYKKPGEEVALFKRCGVKAVCDAACGFGAYSVQLASNGFEVYSFDLSESAAAITRQSLERCGLDASRVKAADIRRTGYPDEAFDGTVAHSVLDHMTVPDAKDALRELGRITKKGGLLLLSFDAPEEAEPEAEHVRLTDGSIQYTGSGKRAGMIFHPYSWAEIETLLAGRKLLCRQTNEKGEQVVILQN